MDRHEAIRGAVTAYAALVQFNVSVPGEERALMYGAAKSHLPSADAASERLAWEIADFLPLALARPELEAKGVQLSDHYARVDSQGRLRTYRRLDDEPIYRDCVALAPELRAAEPQAASAIAAISVEHQTVQQALANGSHAKNLDAGPPILNGPDELCDPLASRPTFDEEPWWLAAHNRQHRSWWKFWR